MRIEVVRRWTKCLRSFPRGVIFGLLLGSVFFLAGLARGEEGAMDGAGITGVWQGVIKADGEVHRVTLDLRQTSSGAVSGDLYFPDESYQPAPLTVVTLRDRDFEFKLAPMDVTYEGKYSEKGGRIRGDWTLGGYTVPLDFERSEESEMYDRPQTPKPPFPYKAEEIVYSSSLSKYELAGTLTLPESIGKVPAVVIVSGLGPNDRNASVSGHQPFAVLADYLTRHGIAVLRYDTRGTGGSTGKMEYAALLDLAADAWAGVEYLKTRPEIDSAKTGFIGHAEGALLSTLAASKREGVAFLVLLGAPGLPGAESMKYYVQAAGTAANLNPAALDLLVKLYDTYGRAFSADPATLGGLGEEIGTLQAEIGKLSPDEQAKLGQLGDRAGLYFRYPEAPWVRDVMTTDPGPVLESVKVPVLSVAGSLDCLYPVSVHQPEIEQHLKAGGGSRNLIKTLSGLNHLLQKAETGVPGEYVRLDETISFTALRGIGDWILGITNESAARAR